ncbi:MAG: single-stranded DNA-binding protein, partial [Planctomycetota bacterium]
PIFLEGRLKLDSWEDKDGQKRSKMRVVIEDFQFVESRSGGGGGGGGGGGESSRGGGDEYSAPRGNRGGSSGQSSGQSGGGHAGIQEDDIPF